MSNQVFRNNNERYTMQVAKAKQLKIFDVDPTIDPSCQLHIQDEGTACLIIEADHNNDNTGEIQLLMEKKDMTEGFEITSSPTSGAYTLIAGNNIDNLQGRILIKSGKHNTNSIGFISPFITMLDMDVLNGSMMRRYKSIVLAEEYSIYTFGTTDINVDPLFTTWENVTPVIVGDPLYLPVLSGVSPNQILTFSESGVYSVTILTKLDGTSVAAGRVFLQFTNAIDTCISDKDNDLLPNETITSTAVCPILSSTNWFVRYSKPAPALVGLIIDPVTSIRIVRLK